VLLRDQIKKEIMKLPDDIQDAALQAEEQRKVEWKQNRQRRLALPGRPGSTLSSANSSQNSTASASTGVNSATPLTNVHNGTAQTSSTAQINTISAQPTIRIGSIRRIGNRMSSLFGK
jgi:hypothetical protein